MPLQVQVTMEADFSPQPAQPQPGLADYGGEDTPKALPPPLATVRASYAHYGLSGAVPELKFDDYFQAISGGKEDDIRKVAASKYNSSVDQKVSDAMTRYAAQKPGEL